MGRPCAAHVHTQLPCCGPRHSVSGTGASSDPSARGGGRGTVPRGRPGTSVRPLRAEDADRRQVKHLGRIRRQKPARDCLELYSLPHQMNNVLRYRFFF